MRSNLFKEPAFILALFAVFLSLRPWFYTAKGGGEGMMSWLASILPFSEFVMANLFDLGYIICLIGIVSSSLWLVYLVSISICQRVKNIKNLSSEAKAMNDLSVKIDRLIQINERHIVIKRYSRKSRG